LKENGMKRWKKNGLLVKVLGEIMAGKRVKKEREKSVKKILGKR
jgi:hypothetical protein